MKKIFTIFMLLCFTQIFSQIEYPRFEIDSLGQKVIVMTIPQAMKLNNNSNILEKFEQLKTEIQDYDNICIKVVNEKDKVITKLNVVVTKQDQQLIIKDDKIKTLQEEINSWIQKNQLLLQERDNREKFIELQNKQLKKMKTKMIVSGIGGSTILIVLIIGILGVF